MTRAEPHVAPAAIRCEVSGRETEILSALGIPWIGGSRIDLKKNVYYDHEAGHGGRILDLIVREKGDDHRDAVEWVDANGICITRDAGRNWQAPHSGGTHG